MYITTEYKKQVDNNNEIRPYLVCTQCGRKLPPEFIIMNDIGDCLCYPCHKESPMICDVCVSYSFCKDRGEPCEKWQPEDKLFM